MNLYRIKYALRHWRRAIAYGRGRLTEDQARKMIYDLEQPAGWYHFACLSRDICIEDAAERWLPHPALPALIDEACQYVAHKWQDNDDIIFNASQWVLDTVDTYAKERGIQLQMTEDWIDAETAAIGHAILNMPLGDTDD